MLLVELISSKNKGGDILKKICSFCGHGQISYGVDIQQKLKNIIEELIIDGVNTFFWGDMEILI